MIHKYFQNGYYIVLDVNSGAVHVVDELFYNMLDHVSEDLAEECPEEIIRAFSDRWSEEEIRSTYAEMVFLRRNTIRSSALPSPPTACSSMMI